MVGSTSTEPRSAKATKVRAILASGLVLGIGAAFTLAAWTDNEWVFGQSGNGGGPGTKTYHMQQNTWTGTAGAAVWDDKATAPGGALTFSVNADNLVPGSTVYAPMQLRAAAGSEALTARLTQAVQSTPIDSATNSSVLYSELRYEAKQNVDKALCNATGFAAVGTNIVPAGSPLSTISEPGVANNIVLPAAGDTVTDGAPVDICFALTLPSSAPETLQGLKTIPLWKFTSTVGS
ncbi:MAG TPA: SipW-dependent-type signal peptide-containing protein [Arthrobacter sp.]|nr:SipW-dependent-type signal peptide-containing protein [Arthrobacter sp.]